MANALSEGTELWVIFTVLGTAAAEGWPGIWCACDACREAAKLGGRDIRRRAAYNIDDRVQIDLGPDALAQQWQFGLDYTKLEHLFFTHSHDDHCLPSNLNYRREGYSILPEDNHLVIHGNDAVEQLLEKHCSPLPHLQAEYKRLVPFRTIDAGEGLLVTPIMADHADEEEAVNFLLESGEGTLLQGNDTGWWPDETWEFLATKQITVVFLDCTYGLHSGGRSHLGAPEVVDAMAHLETVGALAPKARRIATHFSHNGAALHHELVDYFEPHGIQVAYDGLSVEF